MPSHKLPNYIRSHRKCSGLSQEHVAVLLCSGDGTKISRYEHFTQQPNLETAIALEILFRTPVRTLFAGVSEKVERKVAKRAGLLSRNLEQRRPDRTAVRKIEVLETLCCELQQLLQMPSEST
jgi:transcriptional regulator with XRE-family HTH domain